MSFVAGEGSTSLSDSVKSFTVYSNEIGGHMKNKMKFLLNLEERRQKKTALILRAVFGVIFVL